MSVEIPILADAVMVFGLSCAVIVASHKLRIPTIIGFLLTGVLAGPHCLGLVGATHEVEMFAEVGVILLLFVIGLELSLDELIRLKRPVFVGGAAQVLLTIAVMGLPLMFFDVGLGKSLFIGFLAALSSTAIVLKVLGEKAQLAAPHGRIALGALIFQDVAVVPMMLLVPLLAGASGNPWLSLGEMLLKGAFVAGVIFIGARKVVPLILGAVSFSASACLKSSAMAFRSSSDGAPSFFTVNNFSKRSVVNASKALMLILGHPFEILVFVSACGWIRSAARCPGVCRLRACSGHGPRPRPCPERCRA